MVRILVNGKPVHAREEATILEAVFEDTYALQQFDIKIPSIQYLRGVQEKDESGLCVVEVKGMEGLVNAAGTTVQEGMEISTKTPAVTEAQKKILAKILETHDLECRKCLRTGNCELQNLQWKFRMTKDPEHASVKTGDIDDSGIIVRDNDKCVRCGRCVAVCSKVQGIGAIRMTGEGLEGRVVPDGADLLKDTKCVNCGQCITACPVGALKERDDTEAIMAAIADPKKYVIIQTAPSVRASVGEYFKFPIGAETVGKLAAALKRIGFDRVFDTTFGADLTVMEEAYEFVTRLKAGENLPIITSCCPGWVKYCEQEFPSMISHLSTCKSPQQMFGAVIKSYYAEKEGIDKENIVVVSAMPCTAKKFELTRENQSGAGVKDVDYSITARELCRMIEKAEIPFLALENETYDSPLGIGSGAGVIFGATGGVMEAALRTAADWITGKALEEVGYTDVRGISQLKEATYRLDGKEIHVAAVSGLSNVKALMEKMISGEVHYDFVEVMACPGGCVNGGGQPQQLAEVQIRHDLRRQRAVTLYSLDQHAKLRKAHDNPEIKELYNTYLKEPGSEKAHTLLHTTYKKR